MALAHNTKLDKSTTDRSLEQDAPDNRGQATAAQHHTDRAAASETGAQSTTRGSVLRTADDEYWISERLGRGGFAAVFAGVRRSDGVKVAVKVEPFGTQPSQLKAERRVYKKLSSPPPDGIVRHLDYCEYSRHPFGVMELLGPSLQDLFEMSQQRFTLRTAAAFGIEMLQRVKELHECGFIHQDIKPDNFLLRGSTEQPFDIVMIDLAMAKSFRNVKTGVHLPFSQNQQVVGTARYMSRRMHDGQAQSRRDDLESLWYVLIYFVLGRLPWQGQEVPEKRKGIGAEKRVTPLNKLCEDCRELAAGIHHINGLGFEETPDYGFLLNTLLQAGGDTVKGPAQYGYDWERLPRTPTPATDPIPVWDRASAAQATIRKDITDIPNDRNGILYRIIEEGRDLEDHFAFLESRRRTAAGYFAYYDTESLRPFERFSKFTGHVVYRFQNTRYRTSMREEVQVAIDEVREALKLGSKLSKAVEKALILEKQAKKAIEELKASWNKLKGVIEDELRSLPHEVNEGQGRGDLQGVGALKRQNNLDVSGPAKRQSMDDLRQEAARGG